MYLLIAYLVVILGWIAHYAFFVISIKSSITSPVKEADKSILSQEQEISEPNEILNDLISQDYHISFSASLLEDILFFGIVGIIIFILTKRDGSELSLKDRINKILLTNKNNNRSAKEYLFDQISPILAYNESSKVSIELSQLYPENNLVKIYADVQHRILNMCSNDSFTIAENQIGLESDYKVGLDYGTIYHASIVNENPTVDSTKDYIVVDSKPGIPLKNNKYSHLIPPFTISKNGAAIARMSWSIWEKIDGVEDDDGFFVLNKRFTNNIEFTISNSTDKNLLLDLEIRHAKTKTRTTKTIEVGAKQKKASIQLHKRLMPQDEIWLKLKSK